VTTTHPNSPCAHAATERHHAKAAQHAKQRQTVRKTWLADQLLSG
jgi:hypothetical protein